MSSSRDNRDPSPNFRRNENNKSCAAINTSSYTEGKKRERERDREREKEKEREIFDRENKEGGIEGDVAGPAETGSYLRPLLRRSYFESKFFLFSFSFLLSLTHSFFPLHYLPY